MRLTRPTTAAALLRSLEVIGNRLPNPAILFLLLILGLAALSAVLASQNVTAIHPLTHKIIPIKSLFSQEGLHWSL